jgi:hypothetical protein
MSVSQTVAPTPMPVRTRDGSPSVAAMLADDGADAMQIDLDTALEWGRANSVPLDEPGRLRRINEARRAAALPEFRVPGAEADAAPIVPRGSRRRDPSQPVVRSQDELLNLTLHGSGTITGQVTPEIAAWLFDLNTGNRPLRPGQVDRFVQIIQQGGWINTGDPIVVSREGVLNNGQHRLSAVSKTGIPVECDVRFGITRQAFFVTDTGARRTAADVLTVAGHRHGALAAAIARLVWHYDKRSMGMCNRAIEHSQVLSAIEADASIVEVAARVHGARFAGAKSAPYAFVLAVALRDTPAERVFAFHQIVESAVAPDESNPAHRLSVRLREAATARERPRPIVVAAMTVRAWNAWLAGRTLQRLVVTEEDRTSDGFPVIATAPAAVPAEAEFA